MFPRLKNKVPCGFQAMFQGPVRFLGNYLIGSVWSRERKGRHSAEFIAGAVSSGFFFSPTGLRKDQKSHRKREGRVGS